MIVFLSIILTLFLGWIVNLVMARKRILSFMDKFPGAPRHPILGNLLEFQGKTPNGIFMKLYELHMKYGRDLGHWGLFNEHQLVISDPQAIETLLGSSKLIKKSSEYDFFHQWLGQGLLVSHGKKWHSRRKIITPTFHFSILDQFIRTFNDQSNVMVRKLKSYAESGEDVNIYKFTTLCALDVICEASMGVQIHAQDQPESEYVQAVKQMSAIIFKRFFSVLKEYPWTFVLTPTYWEQKKTLKVVHGFTDSVIKMRREKILSGAVEIDGDKKMCLLDMLLHATIDGKPLTNADIREEVDTFMFEGHDTTTSGIAFTLYHLSRHPAIQQKVYEEIVEVLGGGDADSTFDYKALQELKYLEMVCKESLRITPPVPFMGRQLTADTFFDGVKVPSGTMVGINVYVTHNNPELYPEPSKFDPERFSLQNCQQRHPYAYIPFSAGNRNCIGQKFAMLEMKSTVAKMVLNYKLLPAASEVVLKGDLILKSENGVHVALKERRFQC